MERWFSLQTRRQSLLEAVVNILIGFIVAGLSQMIIFPIFDIQTSAVENLAIASYFTIIGLIRSYILRRIFNYLHRR